MSEAQGADYPAMGFVYVDTVKLFYEDTGRVDFELFEPVL